MFDGKLRKKLMKSGGPGGGGGGGPGYLGIWIISGMRYSLSTNLDHDLITGV